MSKELASYTRVGTVCSKQRRSNPERRASSVVTRRSSASMGVFAFVFSTRPKSLSISPPLKCVEASSCFLLFFPHQKRGLLFFPAGRQSLHQVGTAVSSY